MSPELKDALRPLLKRAWEAGVAHGRAQPTTFSAAVATTCGPVVYLSPSRLTADPARFQFRRDHDPDDGTVRELPAEQFDPMKCAPLAAWRDPADGSENVVDGHHRLAWAERDGAKRVPVRFIKAATAEEAKRIGEGLNRTATFAAPGPPPRPGLVWNDGTHRWRNPQTGEEHEHQGGGGGPGAEPSPEHTKVAHEAGDSVTAELAHESPELHSNPTLREKVGQLARKAALAVYWKLPPPWAPGMAAVGGILGDVFDVPTDMGKLGYNPNVSSGTANPRVHDPVSGAITDLTGMGLSGHLVASLASKVIVKALFALKGMVKGKPKEMAVGDDGAGADATAAAKWLADLFDAAHESVGLPPVDRDGVKAAVAKLAKPATFAAPGPAPHPGLQWKEETHRWIHPATGEEHEHEPSSTPAHVVEPQAPTTAGANALWKSFQGATGMGKEYLAAALHNAGVTDPEDRTRLPKGVDPHQVAEQVAQAYGQALRAGHADGAAALVAVMPALGLALRGHQGKGGTFDGRYHTSDSAAFTGDAVTVATPAVVGVTKNGGEVVHVKGKVTPAGKTFAAPGPPPHPGWEWHEETKRWRNPANWEEKEPHKAGAATQPTPAGPAAPPPPPVAPTAPKQPAAPHSFPSGADLANAPSKDLKPGGQVKAVTVGDRKYVVKQAGNTAQTGPIEALAADLARVAGVNMPPATMTTVGGKPALVQAFAEGRTLESLKKESPDAARAALAKVPKEQIDKNVLFDYLAGNTDVHDGNYMVSDKGELTAIDKEMILGRGNLKGQRFEPPHLLHTLDPKNAMGHQFDPKTVAQMADAGDKMAAHLDAKGMKAEARQVRDRVVVLRKLSENPKPTAGSLQQLGSQGVTPPNLGFFGKIKWHLTKG